MIVHFPTITGRKHQSKLNRQLSKSILSEKTLMPETIFDSNEKLRPEVIDILKFACDHPIVLSTGHASKQETYRLAEACQQFGVPALLLNQPANPLTGFDASELIEIAKYPFIWIEQTALTYLLGYQDKQDFKEVLTNVPNCIYSSDLGQTSQIDIAEWLQRSKDWFSEFEITKQRSEEICLNNPLCLLTI